MRVILSQANRNDGLHYSLIRNIIKRMIRSFRCRQTERLFHDESVFKFRSIEDSARRKLLLLHRAIQLQDLRVPPANRLEALKGKRKGRFSIRINDQWRVCFRWEKKDAWDVEIVDYH